MILCLVKYSEIVDTISLVTMTHNLLYCLGFLFNNLSMSIHIYKYFVFIIQEIDFQCVFNKKKTELRFGTHRAS